MDILPEGLKGQSLYDRRAYKKEDALATAAADPRWAETWQELGMGAPTIAGLARICSWAVTTGGDRSWPLSPEAQALLYAAKDRGIFEVKGSTRAFDAPGRMLAVYVEATAERTLIFRSRENPAITIRFLAGFRDLCLAGFVMHQVQHEFSATREGFAAAAEIDPAQVAPYIQLGTEFGLYE